MQKNSLQNSKKIVIKLGSSLLTNKRGGVNKAVLKNVVKDIVMVVEFKKRSCSSLIWSHISW